MVWVRTLQNDELMFDHYLNGKDKFKTVFECPYWYFCQIYWTPCYFQDGTKGSLTPFASVLSSFEPFLLSWYSPIISLTVSRNFGQNFSGIVMAVRKLVRTLKEEVMIIDKSDEKQLVIKRKENINKNACLYILQSNLMKRIDKTLKQLRTGNEIKHFKIRLQNATFEDHLH